MKKLLVALLAITSIVSIQARFNSPFAFKKRNQLKVDNDTDGIGQATRVKVIYLSDNKPVMSYELGPDSETRRSMRNISHLAPVTDVAVIGLSGAGAGQKRIFPVNQLGKRSKLDIDFNKATGMLKLSEDQ